jgi:hypothetical protein
MPQRRHHAQVAAVKAAMHWRSVGLRWIVQRPAPEAQQQRQLQEQALLQSQVVAAHSEVSLHVLETSFAVVT